MPVIFVSDYQQSTVSIVYSRQLTTLPWIDLAAEAGDMIALPVSENPLRDSCQPHKVVDTSPISSHDATCPKANPLIYLDSYHTEKQQGCS
jgi:hypothetical protein